MGELTDKQEIFPRPYKPSCNDEVDWFYSKFCTDCKHDKNDNCIVLAKMYAHDVEDSDYPKELIRHETQIECTKYAEPEPRKAPAPVRCKNTIDMFEEIN